MAGSDIYVREDFSGLGALMEDGRRVFLVYDRNVAWAAEEVMAAVPGIAATMPIEAGESTKTMETVLGICRFLLENDADRNSIVLSLGGGVTTDMAGFAATIFKRGIRYANLPTTLLSQVDAGLGGKTGVNLDGYKNILGRIQQPEFVYIASKTLETLPEAEYRSGMAEMLKTFIIADAPHYRRAMGFVCGGRLFEDWNGNATSDCRRSEAGSHDAAAFLKRVDDELITAAAGIKCDIVGRDEFETGERRVLNLGHTVGHAIEWWQSSEENLSGKKYSHGEAVAVGMIAAARVSEVLGVCEKGLAAQLEADFKRVGLPTDCPVPVEAMENAIRRDKKAEGDAVHFVLIREIGRTEVRLLPVEDIIRLLETANI